MDKREADTPRIRAIPPEIHTGEAILIEGTGWGSAPLHFIADEETTLQVLDVMQGEHEEGTLLADRETGSFWIRLSTRGLGDGSHLIEARDEDNLSGETEVEIVPIPTSTGEGREAHPLLRWSKSMASRSSVGDVTQELVELQQLEISRLRQEQEVPISLPVKGQCNWTPLGPAPRVDGAAAGYDPVHGQSSNLQNSGRARCLAIDPSDPKTLYLGTASGGIWKSEDAGYSWTPKSDGLASLAIGAITLDPNNPKRIIAGTGEYISATNTGYYGRGVLLSTDGGDSWSQVSPQPFFLKSFTRIRFNPQDSTGQHILASCSGGLFESLDGGKSWHSLLQGSISDFLLWESAGALHLLAASDGNRLWRTKRQANRWPGWSPVTSPLFPTRFTRVALAQCKAKADTLYAAFCDTPSYGTKVSGLFKSVNGGQSWSGVALPSASGDRLENGGIWNLALAVHPKNPDIVYLGAPYLYRMTNGQGNWSRLQRLDNGIALHDDHHGVVFDPKNPNIVYDVHDGGISRIVETPGTGGALHATAESLNFGIASLQLYQAASHPLYETILFAGTQDNGGMLRTGTAVWRERAPEEGSWESLSGDVFLCKYDPHTPNRLFHANNSFNLYRSENQGRQWTSVHQLSSADIHWPLPFEFDPSKKDICYFGQKEIMRSGDGGKSWTAITSSLGGVITALAVDPANPDRVYAATQAGGLFLTERSGSGWSKALNIATSPLPTGASISSIAIDGQSNLWIGLGAISDATGPGEFGRKNNHYVFHYDRSAKSWSVRSAKLPKANPINALVIDEKTGTLYCGGDVGLFRWDKTASQWKLWDTGLANASIMQLEIHRPTRLLRAVTFGRGVWERPLDSTSCQDAILFVRDNILDSGRGRRTSGWHHPFNPKIRVRHWHCEDIKVDAQPYAERLFPKDHRPIRDPIAWATEIVHGEAVAGDVNRIYAQVHNRGAFPLTDVEVVVLFAPASAGLPKLPPSFMTAKNPTGTAWTHVGRRQIASIAPGYSAVVHWEWTIPASAPSHSCLLLATTSKQDPLQPQPGLLEPNTLVRNHRKIALKNLHVIPKMKIDLPITIELHNANDFDDPAELLIDWGNLPLGTQIHLAFEHNASFEAIDLPIVPASDSSLSALEQVEQAAGRPLDLNLDQLFLVQRDSEDAERVLAIVDLIGGGFETLAFSIQLPEHEETRVQFDLMQRQNGEIIGGSSYQI